MEAYHSTNVKVDLAQNLGWKINQKKSDHVQSQVFPFLGLDKAIETCSGQMGENIELDPQDETKVCIECNMLDVSNCIASSDRIVGS